MQPLSNQQLAIKANEARILGLTMVHDAASGHPGGSMSCMDLLTTLYFNVMRVSPQAPDDPDRDRFVMSKGHCSPALYPVLALRGFFPTSELKMFRRFRSFISCSIALGLRFFAAIRGSSFQWSFCFCTAFFIARSLISEISTVR